MTGEDSAKIIIVDDHPLIRQGLRDFIEREKDLVICGEADCRRAALDLCGLHEPDLVLVDISLGRESGLDLVKDIASQFPRIKTLVLSMQDEMLYAERVLRAGASGYISKEAGPDHLVKAVRSVLGGGMYASEAVQQKIMQSMKDAGQPEDDPIRSLSDRELAVFEFIGKGRGTADIAETMHLSIKTVETYRARIKTKLQISHSSELVQRAVQWGLSQSA